MAGEFDSEVAAASCYTQNSDGLPGFRMTCSGGTAPRVSVKIKKASSQGAGQSVVRPVR